MRYAKNDIIGFVSGAMVALLIIGVFALLFKKSHNITAPNNEDITTVRETEKDHARKELAIGSAGPDIAEVQKLLQKSGIVESEFEWRDDHYYGEQTQFYVTLFQLTQNLGPHGVVDRATWTALQRPQKISKEQLDRFTQNIPIDHGFHIDDVYYSPTFQKVAYLTFSGGPDPVYTEQILNVLEKYNAGATFFVSGKKVMAHPDLTKKIITQNRNIGVLPYNDINLMTETTERITEEVLATREAVEVTTETVPYCFQPSTHAIMPDVRKKVASTGTSVIMWDVDPQDWNLPGVDRITEHVTAYTQNAEVIRFHDSGGDREQTVFALEQILQSMTENGWTFKPLNCF